MQLKSITEIIGKKYCLPISTPRPPTPLKKTWDLAIFCIAVSPRTYLCRLYVKHSENKEIISSIYAFKFCKLTAMTLDSV